MLKKSLLLGALLLSVALVGCSDDDENTNPTMSEVRVAHLSPDAPAVDVWVDGTRVLENVSFKTFSDYLEVPSGTHNVQVTPAGATTPVVIDATLELADNTAYTVAATGLLNTGDLSPIVLVDDRTPTNGSANVRFVHTSPDAPAVDIAVASGPVLFSNVEFRESADYLSVDQGTYDLSVRLASTSTQVLAVDDQMLIAGTNYTVFAVGLAGNGSLEAVAVIDSE